MKIFLVLATATLLSSCGNSNKIAERKVVPPKGSDEESSIPWNDPGQGPTPGGPLGDMMEGR